jgi:hypothetical protein
MSQVPKVGLRGVELGLLMIQLIEVAQSVIVLERKCHSRRRTQSHKTWFADYLGLITNAPVWD